MASNTPTINTHPIISLPELPNLISSWVAVIPLVVHLATPRADYLTAGDIALDGKLTPSVFPRLGTYLGYSRLLTGGNKFLDFASTRSGSSRMVWDVSWGSTFPCANGSACSAVLKSLLGKTTIPPLPMPENFPEMDPNTKKPVQSRVDSVARDMVKTAGATKVAPKGTRCQTLHVFRFNQSANKGARAHHIIWKLEESLSFQLTCYLIPLVASVLLVLVGAFGSASITFCCAISRAMSRSETIYRPPGYLENNEKHDACMLVASHQNATEWNLLVGDRGVVNTILNKPAFMIHESRLTYMVAWWFRVAHVLQLAAMTFITAIGGWDGVACVILVGLEWIGGVSCHLPCCNKALSWLRKEHIDFEVKSFTFYGRMPMMAAIQSFSGTDGNRWMDDILVPHPRRDALMKSLHDDATWDKGLATSEKSLVASLREAALISAAILRQHFPCGAQV